MSFSLVKVDHETPFHQMVAKHQPALHTQRDGDSFTEDEGNHLHNSKPVISTFLKLK